MKKISWSGVPRSELTLVSVSCDAGQDSSHTETMAEAPEGHTRIATSTDDYP